MVDALARCGGCTSRDRRAACAGDRAPRGIVARSTPRRALARVQGFLGRPVAGDSALASGSCATFARSRGEPAVDDSGARLDLASGLELRASRSAELYCDSSARDRLDLLELDAQLAGCRVIFSDDRAGARGCPRLRLESKRPAGGSLSSRDDLSPDPMPCVGLVRARPQRARILRCFFFGAQLLITSPARSGRPGAPRHALLSLITSRQVLDLGELLVGFFQPSSLVRTAP